jgi:hypothetical protein
MSMAGSEAKLAFPSYQKEGFTVVIDPSKLDVAAIHAYPSRAYWSEGIPRHIVEKALGNSLCFGLFRGVEQMGFARAVTGRATYAYLCDVYVLEQFRGKGLGGG